MTRGVPVLDPKRDLVGATPEKLARALFRRTGPLPARVGKSVRGDQVAVEEVLLPTSRATVSRIWTRVPDSRWLCFPANSETYRCRCFGLILWKVPSCARFNMDQKDSMPLVWAYPLTYWLAEWLTASWSNSPASPLYAAASSE